MKLGKMDPELLKEAESIFEAVLQSCKTTKRMQALLAPIDIDDDSKVCAVRWLLMVASIVVLSNPGPSLQHCWRQLRSAISVRWDISCLPANNELYHLFVCAREFAVPAAWCIDDAT